MKIAQTVRIKAGEEVEQAWVFKAPYWVEVNRLPASSKDESVRYLVSKERTSKLFELSESASMWTVE